MEVFAITYEPKTELEADLESSGDMADDDGHTPDAILSAGKSSIGERPAIYNILLLSCKYNVVTSVFGDEEKYSNTLL